MLEKLPGLRQVAGRRRHMTGRFDDEQTHGLTGSRNNPVGGRRGKHEVVTRSRGDDAEHGLHDPAAGLDVQQLVTDGVAVQRRRFGRHDVRHCDVRVGEQQPAPGHCIRGSTGVELVGPHVPWQQRMVGDRRLRRWLPGLGSDDRGRQMPVVQQRGDAGEALLPHQLLGVQPAVWSVELDVALAGHITHGSVVRHRSSDNRDVVHRSLHDRLACGGCQPSPASPTS